ncbi:MAG: hypothetical protein IT582_04040 [Opitutaceae bacterium]|nr:hypothetical protein [Opitutaceae bacterium]
MPPRFPACPTLPVPRLDLDWRALHVFRAAERGEAFYAACLEYGAALWARELPARAMLCLDRALGAGLAADAHVLQRWPLPYAAMAWIMRHTPEDIFIGNPRVHFQHYADRLRAPRREQRQWRAWACWALARAVRPDWPADPRHIVVEPSQDQIARELANHGHPGEAELWHSVLTESAH